ncbi:helix-turn-helix domain-containing protein [Metabacillus sp. Hm71]|uniref:helix-turn-helix domain-containing protein n=1 Tax=Metabacillus sp. Hm71 TaxID=3450743 RepID=UPI003F4206FB
MPEGVQDLFHFKLEDVMWEKRIKSINELSEKTKISRYALTSFKKGQSTRLDLSTIYTLCTELGCEINDLIEIKKGVSK